MQNEVPFDGVAFGFWIVLVPLSAALVRRALFAFLLGVLFTAAFVGYCMYYAGPVEMGGIIHALCGGGYSVLAFHLIRWLRSRFHRLEPSAESPNSALQRAPDSGSVSKSDATGPAPLS